MSASSSEPAGATSRMTPGLLGAVVIAVLYGGLALWADYPKIAGGFWSDEATYYAMGHSLASDFDLTYRREDLARVYKEFDHGPTGIFLKRGRRVTGLGLGKGAPFTSLPDSRTDRLYFGKSFIYPAFAAPFVRLIGTNGFLVLNTLLLVAAFLAAYAFLSARTGTAIALMLAAGFVFATVIPGYVVWIMPELFNFALGLLAYFCWLYKDVATDVPARGFAWLRRPISNGAAGLLLGIVTFSKITNALLLLPMVAWFVWKREWRRAVATSAVWAVVTAALFGVNVAVSGEWNYQGSTDPGDRVTCSDPAGIYPFQHDGWGIEKCAERGRDEGLVNVMTDPQVAVRNFFANLGYFFIGRDAGFVPYFFPGAFAIAALLFSRRREAWQWFILAGVLAHAVIFIFTQPYTWSGGSGLGDRYFVGIYGACLFLLPPIRSRVAAVVPWIVGGLFVAPVVLNPFHASTLPADHTKVGPARLLPIELTLVNDLPIDVEETHVRRWFGQDNDPRGVDPKFQLYYLDDNSYLSEADRSFWIRGESRAELLIKANVEVAKVQVTQYRQIQLTLTAGPVPTECTVTVGGHSQTVTLAKNETQTIRLDLGPGYPYKKDRDVPTPVWVLTITSSTGFAPNLLTPPPPVTDSRYLGVNVKPMLIQ